MTFNPELYDRDGFTFRKVGEEEFLVNPNEFSIKAMQRLNVRCVELNDSIGMPRRSLSHLTSSEFIEGVSIVVGGNFDLSGLRNFKNLKTLYLSSDFNQLIDFDDFPLLKCCTLVWSKKFKNLGRIKQLEELSLTGHKENDLQEFKELRSLKSLEMIQSSAQSLTGVEGIKDLEQLKLIYMRKLNSLQGVEALSNLRKLDVESCPHLGNLTSIQCLIKLEFLGMHDCAKIDSLRPIKDLRTLSEIYISGNTNIVDGDMTPLLGRKDASIGTRKHYSHSSEEIDKTNGTIRPKQEWDW